MAFALPQRAAKEAVGLREKHICHPLPPMHPSLGSGLSIEGKDRVQPGGLSAAAAPLKWLEVEVLLGGTHWVSAGLRQAKGSALTARGSLSGEGLCFPLGNICRERL